MEDLLVCVTCERCNRIHNGYECRFCCGRLAPSDYTGIPAHKSCVEDMTDYSAPEGSHWGDA